MWSCLLYLSVLRYLLVQWPLHLCPTVRSPAPTQPYLGWITDWPADKGRFWKEAVEAGLKGSCLVIVALGAPTHGEVQLGVGEEDVPQAPPHDPPDEAGEVLQQNNTGGAA